MMHGRLFWKILLSYLGLILIAAMVHGWVGVALAAVVGCYVAYRMTRPLHELTLTATALRQGHYERRIHQLPPNEFGVLGDALNQLGATVARTIATIDQDRAQLAAMIAGMTEGIVATDDSGRVLLCNQAAATLLHSSHAEMIGKFWWESVRVADFAKLVERAQRESTPLRAEAVMLHPSHPRTVQATVNRFGSGRERGMVIVLNDLTQLKRLERIRQDFVANVSHELKTPLTAICGYAETLLHSAKGDATHCERFLQKIDAQARRLTTLVDELLTLARIEESEIELTTGRADWHAVVRAVVERYEPAVAEKRLRLTVDLPAEPVPVRANAEALSVMTSNLLDNAIKYTPAGGTMTIGLARHEGEIRLTVRDSGIGIPPHERTRIFERFYRVDRSRSAGPHGSGLGLAIVKHLTQVVGGSITVESAEGHGSCFVVAVPVAVADTRQKKQGF